MVSLASPTNSTQPRSVGVVPYNETTSWGCRSGRTFGSVNGMRLHGSGTLSAIIGM